MAPTPEGRFADVGPIVCTLWYAKQDFLEVTCCLFVKVFVVLKFLFELMYTLFYFFSGEKWVSEPVMAVTRHGLTIITLVIHTFSIALFPTERA